MKLAVRCEHIRALSPAVGRSCSSAALLPQQRDSDWDLSAKPRLRSPTATLKYALERKTHTAQYFLSFSATTGRYRTVKCTIDESLSELTVEKVHGGKGPLTVSTAEVGLALDLSEEVKEAMRATGFERKVYGFRLQVTGKVYDLATESLEVRDGWTNMMKTITFAYLDFLKSDSLLRYIKLQCVLKETDFKCHNSSYHLKHTEMTVRLLENDLAAARLDIAALLLNDLVTKLEIAEDSRRLADLPALVQDLEVRYQQAVTQHEIAVKGQEERGRLERTRKMRAETETWKLVLQTLGLESVLRLRRVNRKLHRLCSNVLKSHTYWVRMSDCSLQPRSIAWLFYCREFCPYSSPSSGTASSEVLAEIHKDVIHTRPQARPYVKSILTALCSDFEEVGYCVGMRLIVEFLLGILGSQDSTLQLCTVLMSSPYALAEVWKPGLPRLKLLLYQLEELLKLKLPTLAQHFQDIDLPLEVLVAPWILTLFTQLVSCIQTQIPANVLVRIWDLFVVRGWKAVLAVSLSILHLSEGSAHLDRVLGEPLEATMECFHKDLTLDFAHIFVLYPLFEADSGLLEDLKRRFETIETKL